ncbi:precorrin-8X methylmutase [Desulfocurvibacter africanus]|uniref:Precorrin-8X methylmutase CbiC/CobH n=1 Tax=Desulfocurvibacter africanus subsp. africanus str. Walvis Bay TaxID=690850 RepID=F3YZH1_DESAF|nr:precorrin-8X methylmutase [Desulfocurvibacter africanus]EGJ52000.1 Precorrin-8X methylmutase CbiC/CobH [Desulfocurvibacter africanus subsp. africanus str. Walvis Bay]
MSVHNRPGQPYGHDLDLSDPAEIERRSMAIIESEAPKPIPFSEVEWPIVRRMIHTTADFELLRLTRFHAEAACAGIAALRSGALVVTDTRMALAGIPIRRLEALGCRKLCLMEDPRVVQRAKAEGITRAMAAVDLALDLRTEFAAAAPLVFVIGNAPTALVRLVRRLAAMEPANGLPVALIVGMPVGFVNAAESKELLVQASPAPWITVTGRKGGSPLAASAVNALAELALERVSVDQGIVQT